MALQNPTGSRMPLVGALILMLFLLAMAAAVWSSMGASPPPHPGGNLEPPALSKPETIRLGSGRTVTKMDPARDYIIQFPPERKMGATVLMGGHNVVITGGQISVPSDDKTRRALFIKGATGTVHVEGVLVDNPQNTEFDAIVVAAPDATVQLQNIRVEGLRGFQNSWHADILQPWGGVRSLRINGLTGITGYQGIQLSSLKGQIKDISLRRVNLRSTDPQIWSSGANGGNGGYLFWADCTLTAQVSLDQVYLSPRQERRADQVAWPTPSTKSKCASKLSRSDSVITFPTLPIKGEMHIGVPPQGDFVPAGSAGLRYRPSPKR